MVSAIEKENKEEIKAIITKSPHLTRIYVLEKLIPRWATLAQEGKSEEAKKLTKIAITIGQTLVDLQQDKLVR